MDELITLSQVCQRTGFDRTSVWRKRQRNRFPAPAVEGRRAKWSAADIDAWLETLIWVEKSPAWQRDAERFYMLRPGRFTGYAPNRYDELRRALSRLEEREDEDGR